MKSGTMVTVEIVKAKDLKIGDKVLWANHEVEVMRIKNSTVWLKTWYNDWKRTEFVYYYRVVPEKVIFS
jgi:hypothetical protein